MSSVDHAWLRMEHPTNLMIITSIMLFDKRLDRRLVQEVLAERLLSLPRFGERVTPVGRRGAHAWQPDPAIDLDWHIAEQELPDESDEILQQVVGEWMSTPLDPERPLWRFHLLHRGRSGTALLCRIHHCIGDGMALMLALLSVTDREREPRREQNPLRSLFEPGRVSAAEAKQYLRKIMPEAVRLLSAPAEKIGALNRWQRFGASVPAMGRLTFRPPDAKTVLKGPLGTSKRVAWSSLIEMSEVRKACDGLGGTVNDILTTAVAGGLRRYLEKRGGLRGNLSFRAVVPVSLRPLEEMASLGNQFGLIFLALPVGIRDPRERLRELQRRMNRIKSSFEPVVALRILSLIGAAPKKVQDLVVRIFGAKGTAVLTNVPGPNETLYFSGQPIRSFVFWVPQSGFLGMGISILSYAGEVRVGIATDEALVPDPQSIVRGFEQEFAAMSQLVDGRDA